jgi:hypothetical protein
MTQPLGSWARRWTSNNINRVPRLFDGPRQLRLRYHVQNFFLIRHYDHALASRLDDCTRQRSSEKAHAPVSRPTAFREAEAAVATSVRYAASQLVPQMLQLSAQRRRSLKYTPLQRTARLSRRPKSPKAKGHSMTRLGKTNAAYAVCSRRVTEAIRCANSFALLQPLFEFLDLPPLRFDDPLGHGPHLHIFSTF